MNKRIPLNQLNVADLVERFLSSTLAQYEAELRAENGKYNRCTARCGQLGMN